MQTIGQRISYLMKQKGISNIEMAKTLDIDPSYVAKFKSDARRPNTFQIDRIARKLNVSTDYLLGNESSGLPLYFNILNKDEKQPVNLMVGLTPEKHFVMKNQWTTINGIGKDDELLFQKADSVSDNKIYLISQENEYVWLGRVYGHSLYFDNGTPPIDISDAGRFKIEGRLIRVIRYL